jgi:flagellar biosynthesis protein FliR
MGLSAASSYDALSQVENPLLGQFFNLIAMLIFMQNQWFQKLFLGGLTASFKTLNAINLVQHQNNLVEFLLSGLTKLFSDALIIALPVVGTLLLISVCTGLLSKAAPQMNLLSEGFPIMILVAFFILMVVFPNIVDFFLRSFSQAFSELERLFLGISGERI